MLLLQLVEFIKTNLHLRKKKRYQVTFREKVTWYLFFLGRYREENTYLNPGPETQKTKDLLTPAVTGATLCKT